MSLSAFKDFFIYFHCLLFLLYSSLFLFLFLYCCFFFTLFFIYFYFQFSLRLYFSCFYRFCSVLVLLLLSSYTVSTLPFVSFYSVFRFLSVHTFVLSLCTRFIVPFSPSVVDVVANRRIWETTQDWRNERGLAAQLEDGLQASSFVSLTGLVGSCIEHPANRTGFLIVFKK